MLQSAYTYPQKVSNAHTNRSDEPKDESRAYKPNAKEIQYIFDGTLQKKLKDRPYSKKVNYRSEKLSIGDEY